LQTLLNSTLALLSSKEMDVIYCCCQCQADASKTTCSKCPHQTCENCYVKSISAEVCQLSQERNEF